MITLEEIVSEYLNESKKQKILEIKKKSFLYVLAKSLIILLTVVTQKIKNESNKPNDLTNKNRQWVERALWHFLATYMRGIR